MKKQVIFKILIIIGILLVQIGLAYAVITFLLPGKSAPQKSESSAVPGKKTPEAPQVEETKEEETMLSQDDRLSAEVLKEASFLRMEDMIINPAQSNGSRYLLLSLVIYVNGREAQEQLTLQEPAIFDAVNSLISRHSVAWLSDPYNREILREKIKLVVKREMGEAEVLKVYFTKFVMQ
jgi:flagellar FliL protein